MDDSAGVTLRMEDDGRNKLWKIDADAEIGVRGTWGRLEDLQRGDRVWAWIRPDRVGEPSTIFVLVDEISEDIEDDRLGGSSHPQRPA